MNILQERDAILFAQREALSARLKYNGISSISYPDTVATMTDLLDPQLPITYFMNSLRLTRFD